PADVGHTREAHAELAVTEADAHARPYGTKRWRASTSTHARSGAARRLGARGPRPEARRGPATARPGARARIVRVTGAGAGAGASKRVRLEEVSVPRLLFALLRQRFSGTLVLEQPPPHPGRRTVWVRGGMPVFTDWVAPSEVLGQVLQGLRFVTEDQ